MLLHEPLEYWADRQPNEVCLIEGDRVIRYGEAQSLVERIASRLGVMGLQPGDRIAVLGNNAPEVPLIMFAASRAGLVPVPVNPRLAPRECRYIFNHAGVRVVFAAPELTNTIDAIRGDLDTLEAGISWGADAGEGWASLLRWLDGADPLPSVHRRGSDPAYQIYTSGTTGSPKGVVHSHDSVAALMTRWHLCGMFLNPGEKYYLAMPTTLAAGLTQTLATMYSGATLELAKFDPDVTLRGLANGSAATALAPTMVQMLLRANDGSHDFSALRWILYGAAPMPVPVLKEAMDVFGCGFFQGYGQSEAPAVTIMTPEQHEFALQHDPGLLGSLGRPQIGCQIRILDPDDNEVTPGTVGEICTKAPVVMLEYWNQPELTAEAGRSGWHHTGDYGYMTAEGNLFLVDRLANLIISGGYNVYPREVEQVLEEFDEVDQVAVLGLPDELWGKRVTAVVVLAEGRSITADELDARCRSLIASYKIPKGWWIVEELPVNANGKVQRGVLLDNLRQVGTELARSSVSS